MNFKIVKIVKGLTSGKEILDVVEAMHTHAENCGPWTMSKKVVADLVGPAKYEERYAGEREVNEKPSPPTAPASSETMQAYNEALKDYKEVEARIHEIKQAVLKLLDPAQQELLKFPGDNRALVAYSLLELTIRLEKVFGVFTDKELDKLTAALGAPITDHYMIHQHVTDFKKTAKLLKTHDRALNDAELRKQLTESVGGYGGYYSEAFLTVSKADKEKQTLAHVIDAIVIEHERLLRVHSAAGLGFAAAATSTQSAPAPKTDGKGGTSGGGSGTKGPKDRSSPHRFKKDATGKVIAILMDTCYCYSHGPNGGLNAHNSPACPNKEKGHNDAATAENILGGRLHYCHEGNRAKFPHP